MSINVISILVFILLNGTVATGQIFKTSEASVSFHSDAPLEIIEAKSNSLQAVIDSENRTFAFSIPIRSFQGFNSPLQREHFNENYMESGQFPQAVFTGKIIEEIDFRKDEKYILRAKGKFTIHGITQERIIKSHLEIKDEKLYIKSTFTILLDEHQIRVPRIVYQKIAKEILVNISAVFSIES